MSSGVQKVFSVSLALESRLDREAGNVGKVVPPPLLLSFSSAAGRGLTKINRKHFGGTKTICFNDISDDVVDKHRRLVPFNLFWLEIHQLDGAKGIGSLLCVPSSCPWGWFKGMEEALSSARLPLASQASSSPAELPSRSFLLQTRPWHLSAKCCKADSPSADLPVPSWHGSC